MKRSEFLQTLGLSCLGIALSECSYESYSTADELSLQSFLDLKQKVATAGNAASISLKNAFDKVKKSSQARQAAINTDNPGSILEDCLDRITSALKGTNEKALSIFQDFLSSDQIKSLTNEVGAIQPTNSKYDGKYTTSFPDMCKSALSQKDKIASKHFQVFIDSINENVSITEFGTTLNKSDVSSIVDKSVSDFESSYSNDRTLDKHYQIAFLAITTVMRNMTDMVAESIALVGNQEIKLRANAAPVSTPNGRLGDFWDWLRELVGGVLVNLAYGFSLLFLVIVIVELAEGDALLEALLIGISAIGIYALIAILLIIGFIVVAILLYALYCLIFGC